MRCKCDAISYRTGRSQGQLPVGQGPTEAHLPADERGVQNFLREALRVIKAVADLTGDLNKALFWYCTEPLAVFGYKTAERLASEGRTDDVLRYVSSLEAGAAG